MSKISILYWEPGSGGDFVYSLLLAQPDEYYGVIEKFNVNQSGRVVPTVSTFFKENFDHQPRQWYNRTWTNDNVKELLSYTDSIKDKTFVLPTHRFDQLAFLKLQIPDVRIIGITYPSNMFLLVLKNWCKKVAATQQELENHYNQPLHQYLRSKNMFGEYMLSEQIKFGSKIRSSVENEFDTNILLEDLYNGDLSDLIGLFKDSNHVSEMFNRWIKQQSVLHQYQYNIPEILKLALGYNASSTQQGVTDIKLDTFDNILIKHHTQQSTNFNTLQQAADFFKH